MATYRRDRRAEANRSLSHCLIGLWIILSCGYISAAFAESDTSGYSSAIQVEVLKQSGLTINGGLIEYPEPGQPEITTRKVTLPPGAKTGWHYHPVPIVGYILEGELELQLADGLTKTLKTGEVIYEAINAVHQGVNNSSKDVVILAFYLGIEGEPTTIKVPSSK